MAERRLDVICLGRAGVDLYGEQVGGRLEDMASFAKYVGGCPTNIAIGSARLGLRSAAITRVGDEHMGRFIRETLAAEGVDVSHVATDPERLTALVVLGIRDKEIFPLIFYRENCADMAIDAADFDAHFIGSARALLVSGTHFSTPHVDAVSRAAIAHAKAAGTKVVFDIDYRPVLWNLTGKGAGEDRFVASTDVTHHLQSILPDCDLVVGTEEEVHITGGATDTADALRAMRALTDAVIVLKRGALGCSIFAGDLDAALTVEAVPVEVFNVLGAGDAFMSGFLRGWLRDEPLATCAQWANACGALAVSRHGCAPAVPSWIELQTFLDQGSSCFRLREDARLEHLHWATNRRRAWPEVLAFAFDDRTEFEEMAAANGRPKDDIGAFKALCLQALNRTGGNPAGLLCDGRMGQDTLDRASGVGKWIGRPIEQPGSRPLAFEGDANPATTLRAWPTEHCVKCLVCYHPDDQAVLRDAQEASILSLSDACRATGHDLLLEVVPPPNMPQDNETLPRAIERMYELGVFPDWWTLPASRRDTWRRIAEIIAEHDPYCRGVLVLGLDAPEDTLAEPLATAAAQPVCKGFAIGRAIFGGPARSWFAGEIDDHHAVADMAASYERLVGSWRAARPAEAQQA